jgi:hypothetical protein
LPILGFAYKKTKDEKFAKYYADQISDWIEKNPVNYGVNWKCTMEVAIRACNWLAAYDLFKESSYVADKNFNSLLGGSLKEHGDYIFNNLENLGTISNHYFSDIVGLLWISILSPQLKDSKKWKKFALKEFEAEVIHQFHSDGVNFEASTSYHRLVLEMAAYSAMLCQKHSIIFSEVFYDRLEKAFNFTSAITKPSGEVPQFGDNDSGRFLIMGKYFNYNNLDHRYLSNLGFALFPKSQSLQLISRQDECWWLSSPAKIKKAPIALREFFNIGQIAVYKESDAYLAVDASPIGQDGNGGHNHDSAGSFDLCWRGKNIIIDPGTGHYTSFPKTRLKLRSSSSHNTPFVKELITSNKELFRANGYQEVDEISYSKTGVEFNICSNKYSFKRKITFSLHEISITDELIDPVGLPFAVNLTLDPSAKIKEYNKGFQIDDTLYLSVVNGECTTEKSVCSPNYSRTIKTKSLLIKSNGKKLTIIFKDVKKA